MSRQLQGGKVYWDGEGKEEEEEEDFEEHQPGEEEDEEDEEMSPEDVLRKDKVEDREAEALGGAEAEREVEEGEEEKDKKDDKISSSDEEPLLVHKMNRKRNNNMKAHKQAAVARTAQQSNVAVETPGVVRCPLTPEEAAVLQKDNHRASRESKT
uniref:Uncharacterized protein n=1 Tax=Chromera velia CCMP2878 TaxID=1169474 RepID=A0A0G4FZM2_9ALVE|eukprot:Cvel_19566.t1-p1 / transcript=Cvel_19566.t1 / gene=Cvel_19566 / organism=Chromera_velia_CCMP2878 / gene_product=hypothetical protein / transcript_product=hypothetical protein / location=Cvel_scaffold1697:621-6755(-) / protein_length=154 / sequence_SO=supercontig / SO=protein_coding / is_pseudo=false